MSNEEDITIDEKKKAYMKKIYESIEGIPPKHREEIIKALEEINILRKDEPLFKIAMKMAHTTPQEKRVDIMKRTGDLASFLENKMVENHFTLREKVLFVNNLVQVILCKLAMNNLLYINLKNKNDDPANFYIQ